MHNNSILNPNYQYNEANLQNTLIAIDQIFTQYSKVLAIRIDLSFQYDLAHTMSREDAVWYLQKLRNNIRNNQLFQHLITYFSKLEYGEMKGWHFHFCFCFNGQQNKNAPWFANCIGAYWSQVIVGNQLGLFYSCHQKDYDQNGIGLINYFDTEKIHVFKSIIAYLCKIDQTTLNQFSDLPKNPRTFFKGQLPEAPPEKLGRPRLYTLESNSISS